ncbi:MAG: methyltransferase domain-containing protein [Candidatus Omnitrophota bacterium]|jgi:chemotaxis protein methyltransferase CheR|nr:MAG: methyltransferase domain-containing protein [Candidatus Omnitrophota bacterium]
MDITSFQQFQKIIYDKSGIALGPGKIALVSSRVRKRMHFLGIQDHRLYLQRVMEDENGEEIIQLLDVISTNVTYFYRQPDHYDFISHKLRHWMQKGQRRFRFWSTACATGEEPYSLAMKLLDSAADETVDMKILATDISLSVLQKGVEGVYEMEKLKTVPPEFRERFFNPCPTGKEPCYQIKPAIKQMVLFKHLNLSAPPFPMRGPFDAIFCCNVLIYFDDSVRKRLLHDINRLLRPGGYLFIGYSENIVRLIDDFKSVEPAIYQKI